MTASQQGLRQASVRAVTGTALTNEGDWGALFDAAGIPQGDFNGRMLTWLNLKLSTAYADVNQALQALAEANAAFNFSSLGTFDASTVPAAPVNTAAPSLSGIRTQGQVLTTSNGSWSGSPIPTFTYQWQRNASNIAAATAQTYTLVLADVGQSITCIVTATNGSGSASATSNAATIAAALSISGTPGTTGTVGGAYSFTPTTSGGHTTYVFSLAGTIGASGLSFNTATGALTASSLGPAATYGPYTITVTDADGLTQSLAPFSITVSGGGGGTAGQPIGLSLVLTKAS